MVLNIMVHTSRIPTERISDMKNQFSFYPILEMSRRGTIEP